MVAKYIDANCFVPMNRMSSFIVTSDLIARFVKECI